MCLSKLAVIAFLLLPLLALSSAPTSLWRRHLPPFAAVRPSTIGCSWHPPHQLQLLEIPNCRNFDRQTDTCLDIAILPNSPTWHAFNCNKVIRSWQGAAHSPEQEHGAIPNLIGQGNQPRTKLQHWQTPTRRRMPKARPPYRETLHKG
ncbi:hypothetical protein CCHR01_18643 [Colletotrichum chrysophilum]|uniref:Uncharacterized protein n=1 Tax=Colletotrichum chrysophilum TaxID=1836956 RepID=A0AAD9E8G9_9PEZI|nr:hypothetical protein CCHR01_18643 [Colletotrichum chrysophilum]